jgi:hypothetical protein
MLLFVQSSKNCERTPVSLNAISQHVLRFHIVGWRRLKPESAELISWNSAGLCRPVESPQFPYLRSYSARLKDRGRLDQRGEVNANDATQIQNAHYLSPCGYCRAKRSPKLE